MNISSVDFSGDQIVRILEEAQGKFVRNEVIEKAIKIAREYPDLPSEECFQKAYKIVSFDAQYKLFATEEQILERCMYIAANLNRLHNEGKLINPMLVGVLTGGYRLLTEISKRVTFEHEIDWVKVNSYNGTQRRRLQFDYMPPSSTLMGRDVVVLDDIADSGETLDRINELMKMAGVKRSYVVALFKRESTKMPLNLYGFEIGSDWLVGFGMDNPDGQMRNYDNVYTMIKDE